MNAHWFQRVSFPGIMMLLLVFVVQLPVVRAAADDTSAADVPTISGLPAALAKASTYADSIYAMAKAEEWGKVETSVKEMRQVLPRLKVAGYEQGNLYVPQVEKTLMDLQITIAARDKAETMLLANRLELFNIGMRAPLRLRRPTSIELMRFYGRELEIGTEMKDTAKLADTVAGMVKTWDEFRPVLEAHGGTKEVKKFEQLLQDLKKASAPADYARLSKTALDEVGKMEKLFH